MPTETLCTVAVAMAGVSLTLSLASLLGQSQGDPPPPPEAEVVATEPARPVEKVSLLMTGARLKKLCQQHRIHNARWRASARKTAMVRALFAAGVTHG